MASFVYLATQFMLTSTSGRRTLTIGEMLCYVNVRERTNARSTATRKPYSLNCDKAGVFPPDINSQHQRQTPKNIALTSQIAVEKIFHDNS